MRILSIGEDCDLTAMYDRLAAAGHEVRVYIENEQLHDILRAPALRSANWREDLAWVKQAGANGLVLFESALRGEVQDDLRRGGYRVFGGSEYGDRLEADRDFGQRELQDLGLPVAALKQFGSYQAAKDFIKKNPARYVFKNNGADQLRTKNYVGTMDDGSDVIALLEFCRAHADSTQTPDFVLMEHISGVEVGVGAYFNGERFLETICIDWEHKRFFPGDLGELTGEMGTVVSYRGAEKIFRQTLGKMAEKLRAGKYCGYINLNLIANEKGLWPLEFTSRFGYPGYAICSALHRVDWGTLFAGVLNRSIASFPTRAGFAAGVLLTVPPFPYTFGYVELSKGVPLHFKRELSLAEHKSLHLWEVSSRAGFLTAAGISGGLAVATGIGEKLDDARASALAIANLMVVPNLRYRTDIGKKLADHDLRLLCDWGYYRPT
ncbi:MAG: phosphoribosylglycinamide synthetase [Betaproteobacteria bacterium]|nr:phosphoribosylglycinamide synthetase [Betaproteobacteria bacterium]